LLQCRSSGYGTQPTFAVLQRIGANRGTTNIAGDTMVAQSSGVHYAHRLTLKGESFRKAAAKCQKLTATPSTDLM
jgi:hypothetical protein